ncbi:hypothetical protein ACGF0D_39135 [Kitasatospora sp. NPDC048298]|uniref:hypothetical protein n=1 Tax=Kitasatospora sp. NPDC048298 TaxID=3364049 RepID=UPI003712CA5A
MAVVLMAKARWSVLATGLRRLGRTWSVPARAVLAAAALRQAELRLDSQHRNDLLETLLTISTNHTRGHDAALLPAEQLEGLGPAKDRTLLWALLRTGAGVAVVTAAVWAGEWFGLSNPVLMLGALAVFSLAFRRHAERVPDAVLARLSG